MICPDCKREHLHEEGEYLLIEVVQSDFGFYMAQAVNPKTRMVLKVIVTESTDHKVIEEKIHEAFPHRSLHWHWPENEVAA